MRPVVLQQNEQLVFAPYPTSYPLLGEHMRRVQIGARPNKWDRLYSMNAWLEPSPSGATANSSGSRIGLEEAVSSASGNARSRAQQQCWELLPPRELLAFQIPLAFEGHVYPRAPATSGNANATVSGSGDSEINGEGGSGNVYEASARVLEQIPGGLPIEYEQALRRRYKTLAALQQQIREARLSAEQERFFSRLVRAKFDVRSSRINTVQLQIKNATSF